MPSGARSRQVGNRCDRVMEHGSLCVIAPSRGRRRGGTPARLRLARMGSSPSNDAGTKGPPPRCMSTDISCRRASDPDHESPHPRRAHAGDPRSHRATEGGGPRKVRGSSPSGLPGRSARNALAPRLDDCEQLVEPERLTKDFARHAHWSCPSSEDDNGNSRQRSVAQLLLSKLVSVHHWHHEIEEDQARLRYARASLAKNGKRLLSVGGDYDLTPCSSKTSLTL